MGRSNRSEKCSGEEPLFFNEVSVEFFYLIHTNKGGTAIHKPRPFRDWGFFVFIFTKGKIKEEYMMQERLQELQAEALQKVDGSVKLKRIK